MTDATKAAPLRVMIVDDNEIARSLLRDMLAAFGHRVVAECSTLAAALKGYQDLKPDLITLDVAMPDADGIEVLTALHKLNASAKVLVISSMTELQSVHDELERAGATGFLTKPYTMKDLQKRVAEVAAA